MHPSASYKDIRQQFEGTKLGKIIPVGNTRKIYDLQFENKEMLYKAIERCDGKIAGKPFCVRTSLRNTKEDPFANKNKDNRRKSDVKKFKGKEKVFDYYKKKGDEKVEYYKKKEGQYDKGYNDKKKVYRRKTEGNKYHYNKRNSNTNNTYKKRKSQNEIKEDEVLDKKNKKGDKKTFFSDNIFEILDTGDD